MAHAWGHSSEDEVRDITVQTAIVRALLDELERRLHRWPQAPVDRQFADELARLGSRLLDTADQMSAGTPAMESGVRLVDKAAE